MKPMIFAILFAVFPLLSVAESDSRSTIRVVIIGDSLTAGYGISKELAFPARLEELLNQNKNNKKFKVIGAGISGSTSSSLKKRLAWQLKNKPDFLMIALGANDGLRGLSPAKMKENLQNGIMSASKAGIKVILAGMKMPLNYGEGYRKEYEAVFDELGKMKGITYLPFLLKDVGGVKELNQPDFIHPNEKGHQKMAENLLKWLTPLLISSKK